MRNNKDKQAQVLLDLGLTPDTPVNEAIKAVQEQILLLQELQASLKAAQQKAAKPAQAKPKRRDFPPIKPLSVTTRLIQYLESTLDPVQVPSKFTSLAELKAQRGYL